MHICKIMLSFRSKVNVTPKSLWLSLEPLALEAVRHHTSIHITSIRIMVPTTPSLSVGTAISPSPHSSQPFRSSTNIECYIAANASRQTAELLLVVSRGGTLHREEGVCCLPIAPTRYTYERHWSCRISFGNVHVDSALHKPKRT